MRAAWKLLLALAGMGAAAAPAGLFGAEEMSPPPELPTLQGLPSRAVPDLPVITPAPPEGQSYVPLFRLIQPYYDNPFAVAEPAPPFRLDPSAYREVTAYQPPQGLLPLRPVPRLWTLQPFVKIVESYDSNIRQTANDHVGDFYTTLAFGGDLQVGSPDSVYSEGYDTILALNAHYEFSADLFSSQDRFNAIDQTLRLDTRIGRSDFIWRPFLTAEDITGSDFLTVENVGRVERERLVTGLRGDYKLTTQVTWSQIFSHLYFNHPDPAYIDFEVYRNYQEIAYRALRNFDVFAWGEYRYTDPNRGSDGEEAMGGFGWRGKPDPRLFSELLVGWDALALAPFQAGRADRSGLFVTGHTSFEWSPRLRLVLKYDRNYTFNELVPNDNYTNNSLQFAPEIFLGGNWYLTPYFGVSYNQFETSRQETLEFRPELEIDYALPNDSRCFFKVGYDKISVVRGGGSPVEIYRTALGMKWNF